MKTTRMRYIFTALFFVWTGVILAQTNIENKDCVPKFDSISNRVIYQVVDTMPEFPGGLDSLKAFIAKNIRWPNDEVDFQGIVHISVIVETDGSLTNKTVFRGIYEHADKEALRIIEIMPKWKSGKCKGNAVPVKCNIPIKFQLL